MNMKTSKAKSVSADIEVRVKSADGTTYRALVEKRNKKVTYLCQHIRGAFTKDRKIAKPLTELLQSGEYELPHAKHREMVEKLFKVTLSTPERKPRRRRPTNIVIRREEVIPPWLMDDEEPQPQTEAPSDAEIEAALWQEVEEGTAMDVVTSPTTPKTTPAPETPAAKLKTYNIIRAGETTPGEISEDTTLAPGDRLIRIYKRTPIEVLFKAPGQYIWQEQEYPTLTHISWKATGYQIGGNTFFGLPVKRRGE